MRKPFLLLLSLGMVGGIADPAQGQRPDDDRWQIGLDNGAYVWDIRLIRLSGDSLVYRQADTLGAVNVNQIKELRLIRKSEFRMGEGAAGAMNALMGGDDEVYDLLALDFAERIRAIQQIFLVHPPPR